MSIFNRYLETIFRNKVRLLVLVVLLPVAISALNLYLWRSYSATEVVWIPDPSSYGDQRTASQLGFSPYQTPAQNAVKLFSSLLGTQSFNNAVADELAAKGIMQTDRERASLITSLSLLTIAPGGAASAGGSSSGAAAAGGGSPGNNTVTIQYVCSTQSVCLSVLPIALDVMRSQYLDQKAKAFASAKAIYTADLAAADAHRASAIAAYKAYQATLPKNTSHQVQTEDPVLTSLQHDIDAAQKEIDDANTALQNNDTLAKVTIAIINDVTPIDDAKVQKGLYGIKGLRSDNLKTDAIAFATCLAAAAIYLIVLGFLDRSVRDPAEIKARLGTPVVVIPAFQRSAPKRSLKKSA